MKSKKSTIIDVARCAEVSLGTVSRVINGHGTTELTREKVLAAIERLDYRPDMFARGTRSERKNCMGILVESSLDRGNPWLEKTIMAMLEILSQSPYQCMVDFWDSQSETLPVLLDRVDGCLLLGCFPDAFFRRIEERRKPVLVTYDEKMPYQPGVSIKIDWKGGMHSAVQYLLAQQHQRIGLVLSGKHSPAPTARYEGFIDSLNHFGVQVDDSLIAACNAPSEGYLHKGAELTEQLLHRHPELDAVIYASDYMALGGMEMLRKKGRSVPDDVSVVSFDNTDWARIAAPPLTTVGVDHHLLCRRLLGAIEALKGLRNGMPELHMEPRLYKRESTCARNKKRLFSHSKDE